MKQILKTIVISLTLLLPTVCWGGVDGKGIMCETQRLFFNDNKVTKYGFKTINDKVKITTTFNVAYYLSENYIEWYAFSFHHLLNRQTLKLSITNTKGDMDTYECEVNSESEFFEELERSKKHYQSEYDEVTTKNKI